MLSRLLFLTLLLWPIALAADPVFGWRGARSLGDEAGARLSFVDLRKELVLIAVFPASDQMTLPIFKHFKERDGRPIASQVSRSFTRRLNRVLTERWTAFCCAPERVTLHAYLDGMPLLAAAPGTFGRAQRDAQPHAPIVTLRFRRGPSNRRFTPDPEIIRWADYPLGAPGLALAEQGLRAETERREADRQAREAQAQADAAALGENCSRGLVGYCELVITDPNAAYQECSPTGPFSAWKCGDVCVSFGAPCYGKSGYCDRGTGRRYSSNPCR